MLGLIDWFACVWAYVASVSVHFFAGKETNQRNHPLQAACSLRHILEAGRKGFSLTPYSRTWLRRSFTKGKPRLIQGFAFLCINDGGEYL